MACVKERVSDIYAPGRQAETKHQRTKLCQCSQAKVSGKEKAIEKERELSGKGNCGKDEAKFVLINTFIVNAAEAEERR